MSIANPPPVPTPETPASPATPVGLTYRPKKVEKVPLSQRFNWRILVFVGAVVAPIVLVFVWWLRIYLSGGIINYGDYKEVDLKAMSTFDMDQMNAKITDIPAKWRALEGEKIMAIGEMWAPHSADGRRLDYFQLVYSKTKCCFSGPPLAQHFVDGNVVKGAHVYMYDVPVRVFGTSHVYIRKDPQTGVIKSVYHFDVDKVEPIEN